MSSICHGQIIHSLNSNSYVQEMLIHDPFHVNESIDPVEMLEIENHKVETLLKIKIELLVKLLGLRTIHLI